MGSNLYKNHSNLIKCIRINKISSSLNLYNIPREFIIINRTILHNNNNNKDINNHNNPNIMSTIIICITTT